LRGPFRVSGHARQRPLHFGGGGFRGPFCVSLLLRLEPMAVAAQGLDVRWVVVRRITVDVVHLQLALIDDGRCASRLLAVVPLVLLAPVVAVRVPGRSAPGPFLSDASHPEPVVVGPLPRNCSARFAINSSLFQISAAHTVYPLSHVVRIALIFALFRIAGTAPVPRGAGVSRPFPRLPGVIGLKRPAS